jgi:valyl-tRNA synthetase
VYFTPALVGTSNSSLVWTKWRSKVVGPDEQRLQVGHKTEDVLDTWFSSALWPFSTLVGQKTQMI